MNNYFQDSDGQPLKQGDWLNEIGLDHKTTASRIFPDVDTSIDIKSEYNRSDYDYYRPSSKIPDDPIEIIKLCTKACEKVGIVKNVIDLMSEFASAGIKLQHPTPSVQRFYEKWFEKVNGKERSERFLNLFYREGNVIVKRTDARLKPLAQQEWKKVRADLIFGEIPSKYDFLSPTVLKVIGGALANFIGKLVYRLKVPPKLAKEIQLIEKVDPELLKSIPPEFLALLRQGKTEIDLDQSKLHTFFYKKDDWQIWAKPMTYAIMDDLMMYEKHKLADLSALDGAISNVRHWIVGVLDPTNPKNSIIPTKAGINKIRNLLQNNPGGGTLDLVTGPEISFKESASQVYRFLGPEKYEITLNAIYDGLGIPPTLRSGQKGGNSGSFLALKVLVERLQYGRDCLIRFWKEQIELVQKSMGFTMPASVSFDQIVLSDESVVLKLLLDLADRDYISIDSVLEKFDMIPMVEKARVRKEAKQRGTQSPHKASPYHDPQWDIDLKKQLVLAGAIKPDELGIEVKNFKPIMPAGRPNGVKETKKRKPKPKRARTTAELDGVLTWSQTAYKTISDILTPVVLGIYDKSNLRKLTNAQAKEAEYLKFSTLMAFEPFSEILEDSVYNILDQKDSAGHLGPQISQSIARFLELNHREPNLDELRSIYVSLYIMEKFYVES